jgi:hypothetical protein
LLSITRPTSALSPVNSSACRLQVSSIQTLQVSMFLRPTKEGLNHISRDASLIPYVASLFSRSRSGQGRKERLLHHIAGKNGNATPSCGVVAGLTRLRHSSTPDCFDVIDVIPHTVRSVRSLRSTFSYLKDRHFSITKNLEGNIFHYRQLGYCSLRILYHTVLSCLALQPACPSLSWL